jgi:hypothetical protein
VYGEGSLRGQAEFHKHRHTLRHDPDGVEKVIRHLAYRPFRLWWRQIVDEFRRSDEKQNSVAVCVLAAALVEGALTFVVRHAQNLGLGLFGSTTFQEPPTGWKIEKLVSSAAGSGGEHALLDQHTRQRVDDLVRTRQRIHAGRMLVEHSNGVPDLNPEQARDAKRTAELVARRVLEWLRNHPPLNPR